MKKTFKLILLFILICSHKYAFNQDVIIHNHVKEITRKSLSKSETREEKIFTIQNKHAAEEANLSFFYDKHAQIKNISVTLSYPGFKMKSLKYDLNDFQDSPAYPSFELYSDSRVKSLEIPIQQFPVSIHYIIEETDDGTVSFGRWCPAAGSDILLESSLLKITTTNELDISYHTESIEFLIDRIAEKNDVIYTFTTAQVSGVPNEPYDGPMQHLGPMLWITPLDFSYENYKGNFRSWKDHGNWCALLNKNRDALPEATIKKVKEIAEANGNDPKKTAQALYEFLQSKTRYVSVSEGIGSWQPMTVAEVDRTGYGDCKALSFYMQSLLRAAGIPSYYVVIGVDNRRILFPDYASLGQANHAMVCLPFENDTTWLECTSQTVPYGVLSDGSLDRFGLVVEENNSRLIKTPVNNRIRSSVVTNVLMAVDESGKISAQREMIWYGSKSSQVKGLLLLDREQQIKEVKRYLPANNCTLLNYEFIHNVQEASITLHLDFTLDKLIRPNDIINLIDANPYDKITSPFEKAARQNDIVFPSDISDSLHFQITLPPTMKWDRTPENISLTSPCGNYLLRFTPKERIMIVDRSFHRFAGTHSADSYSDILNFYKKCVASEKNIIGIKKVE